MTFARGARTSRAPTAADTEPHGSELTAVLVPSLHGDCDLFGVVRIMGREYQIRGWRHTSAGGAEWLRLKLTPKVGR